MNNRFFRLSNSPTCDGTPFAKLLSTPRFQFILLLLLTLFLCTIKLDDGGLMAYDECYYAQKSKEMVLSGDWMTQRYLGRPCHMNPWLHMWMIAASYRVFGINEWAARFPTCLQTVFIILLTYMFVQWLTRRPWVGMLAASCLLFSDFFFKYAKKAHMDHLVTLLFLVAMTAFVAGRKRHQKWFLVMGLAVGLSMLTKSLLGLMPLAVVAAFVIVGREWAILKRPLFWLSIALALAVGSSWYLYEYSRFGSDFTREHFGWQLLSRTFIEDADGPGASPGTFLYERIHNIYLFMRDAHIWFALGLLGAILSFIPRRSRNDLEGIEGERLLLILWVVVPVVLVSFTRTFKGWYLMPSYVPLAILAAFFFSRIIGSPGRLRVAAYTVLSLLFLYLAVLIVSPLFTLDLKYEIRHPGIRKLATKVRMLEPGPARVLYFPASREIADRHGLAIDLSSYWGFALPWNFYSDHPLDARKVRADLDEVRRQMAEHDALCLTTEEGYRVISGDRTLPFEVVGRAVDRSMIYIVCCSRADYARWKTIIETDHSRSPVYSLRNY
ncbi:MAG TPA: glycosyltransferase family 39 protein [Patescibacteria group bacterium]|nr:glycosyltransferase family 39 protein [Patescibacteria group bacterium]